jgi:hypothetical protein
LIGTEYSKSVNHTADTISIRFPRYNRLRDDKDWQTATSLEELKVLREESKNKTVSQEKTKLGFDSSQTTPRNSPSRSRSPTPQKKEAKNKKTSTKSEKTKIPQNKISENPKKRKNENENNSHHLKNEQNLSSTEEDNSKTNKKPKKNDFSIPFSSKNIVLCGFENQPELFKKTKQQILFLGGTIQEKWITHGSNASHLLVYHQENDLFRHVSLLGGSSLFYLDLQKLYLSIEKFSFYQNIINDIPFYSNLFSGKKKNLNLKINFFF